MNPKFARSAQELMALAIAAMKTGFDNTATWVTQLSWRKFLLFALLLVIAGSIVQDTLFNSKADDRVVVVKRNKAGVPEDTGLRTKLLRSDRAHTMTTDDGTSIRIDNSGLYITKNSPPAVPPAPSKTDNATRLDDSTAMGTAPNADPTAAPLAPKIPAAPAPLAAPAVPSSELHISLPPEIGREVSNAIDDAVDEAAQQQVSVAQKKSSEWFMNFVLLLIVGLFGTKALMGGKKRAEAQADAANAAVERETLHRQVTEAKMQVMQAQVEPHFLFNTLASVEYLIETDPPRASAMQRRLIQYLRAVLPQIRDASASTTLGREASMVRAYLDLLKMRMEERLTVDFQIPDGLRSAAFPPMMLQSLVENAIKHGIEPKPEGGTLRVSAEVVDNRLRVTVSDDGMGFGAVASDGTGLGLQSVRDRLKLLYGDAAELEITACQPTGVGAAIEVPYQLAPIQPK